MLMVGAVFPCPGWHSERAGVRWQAAAPSACQWHAELTAQVWRWLDSEHNLSAASLMTVLDASTTNHPSQPNRAGPPKGLS